MSRLINLGSLNVDHVYGVPRIAPPGGTVFASSYDIYPGGKGLNQSLAAAKAGAHVLHVGCVGEDGLWLKNELSAAGVDVSRIRVINEPTGRAAIQVAPGGKNAIVTSGGANRNVSAADVALAFEACSADDWVLVQNEISEIELVLSKADQLKGHLAINVAPVDFRAFEYDFAGVDLLIVNEVEAMALTGLAEPREALDGLVERYPRSAILLTRGCDGLCYREDGKRIDLPAFAVESVDQTAAGDSFVGYLIASLLDAHSIEDALVYASAAGALAVTHPGAATSIPTRDAVFALADTSPSPR